MPLHYWRVTVFCRIVDDAGFLLVVTYKFDLAVEISAFLSFASLWQLNCLLLDRFFALSSRQKLEFHTRNQINSFYFIWLMYFNCWNITITFSAVAKISRLAKKVELTFLQWTINSKIYRGLNFLTSGSDGKNWPMMWKSISHWYNILTRNFDARK